MLSRTVRIIEAFSPDEPALTVSEIARRSGLHVATASRLVGELVAHGLLGRDTDRKVRLGVRLWELVTRASPTLSLRNTSLPFMEGVHDVVGHHVQLGVLDGGEVLFLERLSAPAPSSTTPVSPDGCTCTSPPADWSCSRTAPRTSRSGHSRHRSPSTPPARRPPPPV
ncbi:IclR family transcriptional regulator [Streptomyces sp. MMS24-I2-30]|uniref:IclR family transcriptional regulator n=1 Tax=Streptomyces sp. MMS24-I2-30 TaxID=3351564 RepID=UPI003896E401